MTAIIILFWMTLKKKRIEKFITTKSPACSFLKGCLAGPLTAQYSFNFALALRTEL